MLIAVLVTPEQHGIDELAMLIGPRNAMLNWWHVIDRTRNDYFGIIKKMLRLNFLFRGTVAASNAVMYGMIDGRGNQC